MIHSCSNPSSNADRTHTLFLWLNVIDINRIELLQAVYQTYVWYSIEKEIVEINSGKFLATYGSMAILKDETEILFLEKELLYNLNFVEWFSKRQMIKAVSVP